MFKNKGDANKFALYNENGYTKTWYVSWENFCFA